MKNRTEFFRSIPFLYLVIGTIWVPITDYLLKVSHLPVEKIFFLEMIKGLLFVFITSILLSYFIRNLKEIKQIEEEKEKLALLIDTMPDFISFKDGEGKCLQMNKFGINLFELEGVNYKGKTNEELAKYTDFYHDALIYCIDTDEEAWKAEKITRCEEIIPLKDGSDKTFDTFKVPIFNKDGSRKALLIIGRDITDLKETEIMLRQSEKLSVLGELAAGIAHEIRNPLTTIKGFMQMGKEKTIKLEDHIDILLDEIDRINIIVNELLLVAKPQGATFSNKNINTIVREVIQLLSTEASLQNILLNMTELDQFDTYCYDSQLKQVFINILKNAMEAISTKGEVNVSIYDINEDYFAVTFEDNGCGIEENRLKHIGEPFYSVKEKGIGLGMTVSFRIIESHKGSIHITSQVNLGTSVEVWLPKSKFI
ncbi:ATP-binding protein [Domibacillus mangrovi]|uniref:histidine kinase n=1 Tax=Domibacillus mangrovi TaxID=1714354 RepID=A0A1Q5P1S6_9BACI|nr:ATP-binding protein [Domibacillus mangrovi]OKL36138.1 two-component sensor histidine kinase [Domibacillus mangrovi]